MTAALQSMQVILLKLVFKSLVCIIPGEIDVRGPTAVNWAEPDDQAPFQQQPPLKLVKTWQRLKSGQWVIGAVVHNLSSK